MIDIKIQLFNAFYAKDKFGKEINFRDNKVRALLAYLIVEHDQIHRRNKLVELFWGDAPQERAQHSLRMALTRLRQSLESAGVSDILKSTRQSVKIQLDSDRHWVDVVEFDRLVAKCRKNATNNLAMLPLVYEWMAKAVDLYHGSFLAGLSLSNSPSFDDWLMLHQSRYEQQALIFLDLLAEHALTNQQNEMAENFTYRQLEILPWLENSHRQLMRIFAQRNQWQLVQLQYQKCIQVLDAELGTEPDEETRNLFKQLNSGKISQKTYHPITPKPTQTVSNNLPSAHTSFFGREVERDHLIETLLNDAVPLITVVGPGGVGKTRLTLDAVRQIAIHPDFPDGVWFIPLDGMRVDDKDLNQAIANTIAKAMGLELRKPSKPYEQLLELLRNRRLILVLDNFEQLISGENDGVDFVLDLINLVPRIKVVVTSRRPLNLQLESMISLDGLPVPQILDDRAYNYSSVLLFLERGKRANNIFSLDDETLPAVVEICQLMGGMPLALEMVAVRLREMSCNQILHTLKTNQDLLKSQLRDLPPRHRSMQAVFDWSWSLLELAEKSVLSELSVFRNRFTFEAAQAVTGASSEQIHTLIEHSLIRFDGMRYSLHELLRQFAFEKLAQPEIIQAKHSSFYLKFVLTRREHLIGKDLVRATAEIRQDWENIQQAWSWAISNQEMVDFVEVIVSLGRYLRNNSMIWFGEKLFQEAIDNFQEHRWKVDSIEDLPRQKALGQLWLEMARCYIWSAQYETCVTISQRVITIGKAINSYPLIAGGYLEWGRALWRLGEYQTARELLESVVALAPEQSWQAIQALTTLGNIYSLWGKTEEALNYYKRSLQVQKEADIWSNRAQVLNHLATIATMQGQFKQAVVLLFEVLDASRQFEQEYFQVTTFHNLGLAYSELGQYSKSEEFFKKAMDLSKQLQNRHNETEIWLGLAQLYRRLGQYQESKENLQQAFTLCQQSGEKKAYCEALMQQALLLYAQESFLAAAQASRESVKLIKELGTTEMETDILITVGYCSLALSDYGQAKFAFKCAVDSAKNSGNSLKEIEASAGLANVCLRLDERHTAEILLRKVLKCVEQQISLIGTVLPLDLYWHLSQNLAELDIHGASTVLHYAQALIQDQALTISNLPARRHFLHQPICKKIILQYKMLIE
jgi:predicted ATPase/DNA-binding SARP family transcriptional activator/Tfp pilus assembly protein PilF